MKRWFLLALYIALTLRAGAYVMPVIDAANLEQQVQNEYQNLTQYLATVSNTLKSAQQLEQQVLQTGQYANMGFFQQSCHQGPFGLRFSAPSLPNTRNLD